SQNRQTRFLTVRTVRCPCSIACLMKSCSKSLRSYETSKGYLKMTCSDSAEPHSPHSPVRGFGQRTPSCCMRHPAGVHEVQYRPVTFVCTVRRFCGVKMPTNLAPLTLPYLSFSPLHLSITTSYRLLH